MPQRGKTPKRAGQAPKRTPKSSARTSTVSEVIDERPPDTFKTPQPLKRSTRASKTPGWFSPTEDTFKLPTSPSPNRRQTRRSTVFKSLPEYSSFIPIELSPRRTRRSSIYKKGVEPAKNVQHPTNTRNRRQSVMAAKPTQPTRSSRRSSVYQKKVSLRLADNLTDLNIIRPSSRPPRNIRPAEFSPIKTRRQSMLPKSVIPMPAPKKKVAAPSYGQPSKTKLPVGKKTSPRHAGSVQKATLSSLAKTRIKDKSPAAKKGSTTTLKSNIKKAGVSEETVFVNDLISLTPALLLEQRRDTLPQKVASDIVLSPRGARTKTRARSATTVDVIGDKSNTESTPNTLPEINQTAKTDLLTANTPVLRKSSRTQTAKTGSNLPEPLQMSLNSEATVESEMGPNIPVALDVASREVLPKSTNLMHPQSRTPRQNLTKTPATGRTCESKSQSNPKPAGTPSTRGQKRAVGEIAVVAVAKKAKMDNSVYTTPILDSPRPLLRKATASVTMVSPATPEFLTPVGNQKKKFRKDTPMRLGMQTTKQLKTAQSTPSLRVQEPRGCKRAVKQTSVVVEDVAVIDGNDILIAEEFNKSDGLDFVDAAQIKEPLEPDVANAALEQRQGRNARCTIL